MSRSTRKGQIEKRCCSDSTCRCSPKKYLIRVYLGRIEGKRKYISRVVEGTKTEAEQELTRWLRDLDQGEFTRDKDHMKVSELTKEFLQVKQVQVASSTMRHYETVVKVVDQGLGFYKLRQLSPGLLQGFFLELQDRFKPRTLAGLKVGLSGILALARARGYMSTNPLETVSATSGNVGTKAGNVWSSDQIAQFFVYIRGRTRYEAFYFLLFNTGMRPHEALGLQWGDFRGEEVTIRRTVRGADRKNRHEIVEEGKTGGALGRVRLPAVVLRSLQEHQKAQIREGIISPWVFATKKGDLPTLTQLRRGFQRLVQAGGLPQIRMYDARHTHATELLEAGVPIKVIQERLRHADVSTTLNVYSHVTPKMDREVVDLLDRLRTQAQ